MENLSPSEIREDPIKPFSITIPVNKKAREKLPGTSLAVAKRSYSDNFGAPVITGN